ncbi:adhesion G protein-coupled receptor L2-like [Anneissia japonica]|uniref:adhesion G protein-coupled receptor L2-like n=1 Tax=Anneissia japonica TaxID=1529436 RepID=UPI001425B159|nr:adhesion G protein-coupled receptor L2-like [Anneissia japonica]
MTYLPTKFGCILKKALILIIVVFWRTYHELDAEGSIVKEIICEGHTGRLTCNYLHHIKVVSARYGRYEPGNVYCASSAVQSTNCGFSVIHNIADQCNDKTTCDVRSSNSYGDPCPGTHKYTEVDYECIQDMFLLGVQRPQMLSLIHISMFAVGTRKPNKIWETKSSMTYLPTKFGCILKKALILIIVVFWRTYHELDAEGNIKRPF